MVSATSAGDGTDSPLKISVNIFVSFIGAGILGLPYAFRQAGLMEGVVTMVLVAFFAVRAMLLVIECKYTILARFGGAASKALVAEEAAEEGTEMVFADGATRAADLDENLTYGQVGFYAAGPTGQRLVDFSVIASQIGFCCAYLIFITENLGSYVPWVEREVWLTFLLPALFLLTLYRELHKLAFFSLFAQISNLTAFGVVFWFDFEHIVHVARRIHPKEWSLDGFPFFFAVAIYCYEGAGMILALEYAVAKPIRHKFIKYFLTVITFVTALYVLFGAFGYVSFGPRTKTIITLNLPRGSGVNFAVGVKLCLCLSLFFTYPVMLFPVTDLFERRFISRESRSRRLHENALRLALVATTGIIVVSIPSFANMMALIGATCCTMLAFILPATFHLLLHDRSLSASARWLDYWLIFFGLVAAFVGTADTFHRLYYDSGGGDGSAVAYNQSLVSATSSWSPIPVPWTPPMSAA